MAAVLRKGKFKPPMLGDDMKISKLFNENYVTCIGHDFLLSPLTCACCPRELKAEAFTFSYEPKAKTDKKVPLKVFHTGPDCFEKIAKHGGWIKKPPRINIFKILEQQSSFSSSVGAGHESSQSDRFTKLGLEVLLVISLIFIVWKGRKPGLMQKYYDSLLADPGQEISSEMITNINKTAESTVNNYNNPPKWLKKPDNEVLNVREAATATILLANKGDKEPKEYVFPRIIAILDRFGQKSFI